MDISIHAPAKGATQLYIYSWLFSAISIHAPAKGATIHLQFPLCTITISIHAPAKGATRSNQGKFRNQGNFNPRSREGSDKKHDCDDCPHGEFQSTLPRRERRHASDQNVTISRFQSTLPRRERPCSSIRCDLWIVISIHAPAKGATCVNGFRFALHCISIHAPAKGATHKNRKFFQSLSFQSTLPRRERRNGQKKEMEPIHISIHAPAKGATHSVRVYVFRVHISIHAPAKGATFSYIDLSCFIYYFNPRSREGSDK